MTVHHFYSKRAFPISKSAENNSDCHLELQSDAQSAEWSAEDDSAFLSLFFEARSPNLKKGGE
jgi:hypothetical protein